MHSISIDAFRLHTINDKTEQRVINKRKLLMKRSATQSNRGIAHMHAMSGIGRAQINRNHSRENNEINKTEQLFVIVITFAIKWTGK